MSYESQPELNKFDVDSKKALLDRQQFMVTDLKRQVEALTVRSPVKSVRCRFRIAPASRKMRRS